MKLGLVSSQFKVQLVAQLSAFLRKRDEVVAAYLFGSAAVSGPVVNDIDILVLLREEETNRMLLLLSDLDVHLAEHLGVSTDEIDLIPFDLRLVEPEVLYDALDTGILLRCSDEEALTDAIESLSRYFLENEESLRRKRMLEREMFA